MSEIGPKKTGRVEPDGAGWAPADPADGRKRWDWESKWDGRARRAMRVESAFLVATALAGVGGAVTASLLLDAKAAALGFDAFLLASAGAGLIGGVTFGFKWFYHVIARGYWHLDRRYWRCMAPYISAVLAVIVALASFRSDLTAAKPRLEVLIETLIVSFLAGYFSDGALAKLAEVAQVAFGKAEEHKSRLSDQVDRRSIPESPRALEERKIADEHDHQRDGALKGNDSHESNRAASPKIE
ncbi:MAG: hypothetical protein ACOY0T_15845 [Myxococcota bacterium]